MKILYPYNEILPLKRAHDAYIVRTCASLAQAGHEVSLLIGQGSLDRKELFKFYKISPSNSLKIIYLPILRRKNLLRLQANALFFWFAQREIEKKKPDLVIFSVLKQAQYHLKRKLKNSLYLYEVHQLKWYPNSQGSVDVKKVEKERKILSLCDLITVTTLALREILKKPPYRLNQQIELLPLASDHAKIETKPRLYPSFQLYYVGQLYHEQGLKFLFEALEKVEGITLTVIGGKPEEVREFEESCKQKGISEKVHLLGFMPSEELQQEVQKADAFITPFQDKERMAYVAHTKLIEYKAWQRPILAPDLEIVHQEVPHGVLYFKPGDRESLQKALYQIQSKDVYQGLLEAIQIDPSLTWEKRGCLFNKVLNKMPRAHEKIGT